MRDDGSGSAVAQDVSGIGQHGSVAYNMREGISMTRGQARALAKKLRAEGKTWEEVAVELGEKGYISDRTKKPLSYGGAHALAVSGSGGRVRRRVRRMSPRGSGRAEGNVLELMRGVLEMKHVEETTRIAMLELIAELGNRG